MFFPFDLLTGSAGTKSKWESLIERSLPVTDGDRQMVNPITCQVLFESACPFPKSFQGRLHLQPELNTSQWCIHLFNMCPTAKMVDLQSSCLYKYLGKKVVSRYIETMLMVFQCCSHFSTSSTSTSIIYPGHFSSWKWKMFFSVNLLLL